MSGPSGFNSEDYPSLASLDGLLGDPEADRFEVLDTLLEMLVRDTGAERGTIFLVDQGTREIFSAATRGREVEGICLPVGRGVAGKAAQTGETYLLHNAYSSSMFDPEIDEITGYRTENLLTVPCGKDPVTAVVQLLNKPGGFTAEDAGFLEEVCTRLHAFLSSDR